MDISRLKKKDLQVWLPLVEGVDVLCRHIPQSVFDGLQKECTVVKFDPRSHRKTEELDQKKFRSALSRAVVVDWKGIVDGDKEFPCTPENTDYLMNEMTEFRLLVMDAPLSLEKMLSAEKDETEKNSLNTSAPSSTSRK